MDLAFYSAELDFSVYKLCSVLFTLMDRCPTVGTFQFVANKLIVAPSLTLKSVKNI